MLSSLKIINLQLHIGLNNSSTSVQTSNLLGLQDVHPYLYCKVVAWCKEGWKKALGGSLNFYGFSRIILF
jgi:hypothetical protein